ncbi:MAG: type II toxin-antitoxin system RnlB family antitoxin [Bacteroidota bacterium]
MIKYYQIQKINSSDYNYAVISKDWHRIDDYIIEVSDELKKKTFKGSVLFDCLLSNGNSNRFLEAYFDGYSFDFNSFREINKIDNSISKSLDEIYKKNLDWIEFNNILSHSQKFLLKKKLTKSPKKIIKRKMQLA